MSAETKTDPPAGEAKPAAAASWADQVDAEEKGAAAAAPAAAPAAEPAKETPPENEPDTDPNTELADAVAKLGTADKPKEGGADAAAAPATSAAESEKAADGKPAAEPAAAAATAAPAEEPKVRTEGLEETSTQLKVVADQDDPNSPLYSVKSFAELGLSKALLDGVYAMGFSKPSRIQEHALPLVLTGKKNLIAQAQSGTGKTAAFTLSMLALVDPEGKSGVQALCVCPTRELARQNADVCERMMKFTGLPPPCLVVRDANLPPRITSPVVIGTPGKILDVLTRRVLDARTLRVFVLDEADVMIDTQGQGDQTKKIKARLPKTAQVLLFSATYADAVRKLAERIVPKPVATITLPREELSLDKISQYHIACKDDANKYEVLEDLFAYLSVGSTIIFVARKATATYLNKRLTDDGHQVALLTGDLQANQRDAVIDKYRSGESRVLISTNVLARGIDILQVNLVVNYDPPVLQNGKADPSTYLHRIGRSGRFGRSGIAINFHSTPGDKKVIDDIAAYFKRDMVEFRKEQIPELAEMLEKLN